MIQIGRGGLWNNSYEDEIVLNWRNMPYIFLSKPKKEGLPGIWKTTVF